MVQQPNLVLYGIVDGNISGQVFFDVFKVRTVQPSESHQHHMSSQGSLVQAEGTVRCPNPHMTVSNTCPCMTA